MSALTGWFYRLIERIYDHMITPDQFPDLWGD